jgi:NTP pyrophosphatase (non-canonical NTP hydrolase)
MKPNDNKLTNAETERLAILTEEMGECLQIIGKIQRHGYESRNPLIEGSKTNREKLELEMGDVLNALHMMVKANDLDYDDVESHSIVKAIKIKQWLHHQDDD